MRDSTTTLQAAEFSHYAYPKRRHLFKKAVRIIHGSNDEYDLEFTIVLLENSLCYLCFPGTESFEDLRVDLRAGRRKTGKFKIHAGVSVAIEESLASIESWLAKLKYNHLIVCGHSLGGMYAGAFTLLTNVKVSKLITFGAPAFCGNVGVAHLAELENSGCYLRIVNLADPVPSLTPWVLGYRHGGAVVWLRNRTYQIEPNGLMYRAVRLLRPFVRWGDHYMCKYLKAVRAIVTQAPSI